MRLLLGLALAVSAALTATTLAVPAADAAGPSGVTLVGRGYGHGKGMSQYGAQNAAAHHDRTANQILAFYYPRTSTGKAGGVMKVLVTADTTDDVVVRHRSGLTVHRVGTRDSWRLSTTGAQRWRIVADSSIPGSRVDVRTDSGWRLGVRRIRGEAEFRAGGEPMRLYTPSGSAVYDGRLRSAYTAGRRNTVNVVHLEEYLQGVVPREVPATWHPQAVRAQAIAARTYAAFERDAAGGRYFDVWDTVQSQVYGGVGAEHSASNAAIAATSGQVRTYGGEPAFTQFGSSNGGWTVKGSRPYLVAKQDPYDLWSGNPNRRWEVRVSDDAVQAAWPAIGDFQRLRITRRDGRGTWGGRATEVYVRGSKGSVRVSGDAFRSALGLRSTMFVCPGGVDACP